MSYRLEQNPFTGANELVIDGWERGISEGPYSIFSPSALGPINQTGMVDLSYGNITGIPGEFSVEFPLAASTVDTSGGVSLGTPVQKAVSIPASNIGQPNKYYMLDGKGQVFVAAITAGGVWPNAWTYKGRFEGGTADVISNNGLVWWQGYLFGIRDGSIFYSSDDGVSWTDWSSSFDYLDSDGSPHYAITSLVADAFYFCNGAYVASVTLTAGSTFDPTNGGTYKAQGKAVSIPAYDRATCLAEINGQILIGGSLNRVYPWDALNFNGSGITSLTGIPLFVSDQYIQRIVTVNSNAYIFVGTPVSNGGTQTPSGRGYIYISNGSTLDVFQKMPDAFVSIGGASSDLQQPYWQFGDAMYHRNKLIFGAIAISNKTGSTITDTGGVWAIDLNSSALYRLNQMTGGNTSLPQLLSSMYVGSNIPGLGYFAGATGVMNSSTTTLSTAARVISDKIPVGTNLIPRTYEQLEVKTAVALAPGETIAVTLITDLDPAGHSVGTMTSADGVSKVFTPLSQSSSSTIQGIQWLQVQALLTPTNTNPTFVRLREIRLR